MCNEKGLKYSNRSVGFPLRCYNRAFVSFTFDKFENKSYVDEAVRCLRRVKYESCRPFFNIVRQIDQYMDMWETFSKRFISNVKSGAAHCRRLVDVIEHTIKETRYEEEPPEDAVPAPFLCRQIVLAVMIHILDWQLTDEILKLKAIHGMKATTATLGTVRTHRGRTSKLTMYLLQYLAQPFIVTMSTHYVRKLTVFASRQPAIPSSKLCHFAKRVDLEGHSLKAFMRHDVHRMFAGTIVDLIKNAATLVDMEVPVNFGRGKFYGMDKDVAAVYLLKRFFQKLHNIRS